MTIVPMAAAADAPQNNATFWIVWDYLAKKQYTCTTTFQAQQVKSQSRTLTR